MFGRATIRLGIGPHSSCIYFTDRNITFVSSLYRHLTCRPCFFSPRRIANHHMNIGSVRNVSVTTRDVALTYSSYINNACLIDRKHMNTEQKLQSEM